MCEAPAPVNPSEQARAYSSVWDNNAIGTGHARSMLDSLQAWSAATNSVGQWMQVDLGATKKIVGTVVQGRANLDQWITKYKVRYSTNGSSWRDVPGEFAGNIDRHTKRRTSFTAVSARYVRFVVQSWHKHISMRAGVLLSGHA